MKAVGRFVVEAGHPALPGHFPGRPVVPGVLLLEEVVARLGGWAAGFPSVRFLRPVLPGEVVEVWAEGGRFEARVGDAVAVQGSVLPGPIVREPVRPEGA